MDLPAKQREFENLKQRVAQLEEELAQSQAESPWQPRGAYPAYFATTGFILGMGGALAALLANALLAPLAGKHPLELILVFLTFPLGDDALTLTSQDSAAMNDGLILILGCSLFIATGMLLGIVFQLVLAHWGGKSVVQRLAVGGGLGLVVWLVGFYGILTWLQPLLFGGNWITDPAILPWWVAAGTHLVYGLTMALLFPLGHFRPSELST